MEKAGRVRDVTLFRWEDVPEEQLSATFSRKLITGGRMMFVHVRMKKGGVVPAHQHENEQLSYVLSGALKFDVGGREVIVREGEVLVVPSNVVHGATALEDTLALDAFSPPRQDFLDKTDYYLRDK
jgi:quercetin dioxygenase-like cupin family protein